MTHYVVPIAGHGNRFRDIGLEKPKWSLEINGNYILFLALSSLPFNKNDTLTLISQEKDEILARKILNQFRAENVLSEVLTLKEVLNGQALTVLKAIAASDLIRTENLVIWCGDCFTLDNALENIPRQGNWLATCNLPGDHWSFAEVQFNNVVKTTEKVRISEHASIGLYGFENTETFRKAIMEQINLNTAPEIYVAPLYNFLIKSGEKVTNFSIPQDSFVSVGTPEEIIYNCEKFNWSLPKELARA